MDLQGENEKDAIRKYHSEWYCYWRKKCLFGSKL